jgi:hypothetical protein
MKAQAQLLPKRNKQAASLVPTGFLHRKKGPAGMEEESRRKRQTLQRKAVNNDALSEVPPIVHEVLHSLGRPLNPETRASFEPRFGHDFSNVRVHTDAKASGSAKAVNALAYTAGHNMVFGKDQYAPETEEGRRLLAHELTHIVQQATTKSSLGILSETAGEREAVESSARVTAGQSVQVQGQTRSGVIQRQDKNPLDEKAKKIIEAAKDASKGIDQRAIDAVNNLVKTYYDPALVGKVVYDEKDPGLTTIPIGIGKDIKGQITVGKYFIENIDSFARRVLQVGHELEHVRQQRSGMGGPAKKNEREFLAFHWEATQPEKAGTGRMPHAGRVALIDEALRNYYCMPDADQKTHFDKKEELLKLRETEEKASGREHKDPPKECEKKK